MLAKGWELSPVLLFHQKLTYRGSDLLQESMFNLVSLEQSQLANSATQSKDLPSLRRVSRGLPKWFCIKLPREKEKGKDGGWFWWKKKEASAVEKGGVCTHEQTFTKLDLGLASTLLVPCLTLFLTWGVVIQKCRMSNFLHGEST